MNLHMKQARHIAALQAKLRDQEHNVDLLRMENCRPRELVNSLSAKNNPLEDLSGHGSSIGDLKAHL